VHAVLSAQIILAWCQAPLLAMSLTCFAGSLGTEERIRVEVSGAREAGTKHNLLLVGSPCCTAQPQLLLMPSAQGRPCCQLLSSRTIESV
jgi:hypothetical protein